jgi:Ca2+-binding RTX toxin-like protein
VLDDLVPLTASSGEPPLCGSRVAVILGTPGDDVIYGTEYDDIIAGMGGNDRIFGLGGNDRICGDVTGLKRGGNDIIDPGAGSDRVLGDGADTTIAGNDNITGGDGNKVFVLGDGDFIGIAGNDRVPGCRRERTASATHTRERAPPSELAVQPESRDSLLNDGHVPRVGVGAGRTESR